MSHEIRTPLNGILGITESLGEQIAGPLNEKQQKYITTISESGRHLLSLINDILDLSKIEAGQITLDLAPVEAEAICQGAIRLIKEMAQRKRHRITVSVDGAVGTFLADPKRLKQVLVNLLSNAVKFTPEGGEIGLSITGDLTAKLLEFAVWDNGSTNIVNAINAAYNRGVQVRYISSSNSANTALSGLNAAIPVLERQSLTLTMHNKFVIINNAILMTGSMNFGLGSMFDDYNNFIIINNSSLALNYQTEFNEMWGGSGAQPNLTLSKFGSAKTDNTIHNFTIASVPIESYFSPSDGTTAKIVNAINSANYTLDFATFTFNHNDIGDAVIAAKNRGVIVRGIIENVNYLGSEYPGLVSNGINVLSHLNVPYDFHHKYGIVDAGYPASDPLVIMGSHNWTNSAENDYDENTLIIHDNVITSKYLEKFTQRFNGF